MEGLAFVLIVLLTVGTMTGVIYRYVFQSPIVWMYEVVVIIFAWTIFAGVYLGFSRDEHIRLTFVLNALHKRKRAVLEIIIDIISVVFLFIVIYFGSRIVRSTMSQIYNTIPVPIGVFYAAFPVMGIPMVLGVVDHILAVAESDKSGELDIHEVEL